MDEALALQEQLNEKWVIVWWGLCTGLLALAIAWRQGLFNSFQPTFIPKINGGDVFKGFGFYLGATFAIAPLFFGIISILSGWKTADLTHLTSIQKGVFNLCMILAGFMGVILAYIQLSADQKSELWKQTPVPWYRNLGVGIVSWFVIFPLVIALGQMISLGLWYVFSQSSVEQVAVQHIRSALISPWLFGLTALTVTTLVPFTEEYLFRGLLQNWFKQKFQSVHFGIIVSSLIFALFHFSMAHGLTNIELLTSLFFLSCMLGYVYERQRSLWASIGLHGFFNLISLVSIFKE